MVSLVFYLIRKFSRAGGVSDLIRLTTVLFLVLFFISFYMFLSNQYSLLDIYLHTLNVFKYLFLSLYIIILLCLYIH